MPFFDATYTNAQLIPAPPNNYRALGVMVSQPWTQPHPDNNEHVRMVEVAVQTVAPFCSTLTTAARCLDDDWPQHALDATAEIIADLDHLIAFLRTHRDRLAAANDQLARETLLTPHRR